MTLRFHRSRSGRERGIALLMGMVMLVVMTLVALVAIKLTASSVQVVGNSQFRQEATAAGQKAIEILISQLIDGTKPPSVQNIDVNMDGKPDFKVEFLTPVCMSYKPANPKVPGLPKECYGSGSTSLCYWTVWDIVATVSDISAGTGTTVTIHQGVRTIAGLDSALKACGA